MSPPRELRQYVILEAESLVAAIDGTHEITDSIDVVP
jgi:hypothetical protein